MSDTGMARHCTGPGGFCFAAAVAVFLVLTGCSSKEADLLRGPDVTAWQRFFFARGAGVEEIGTMKFSCTPIPLAAPLDPAAGSLVCNEPGSACLAIDTGYLLEQGRVVRGEPDSSVSLYYPREKSMCRFMTIGTAGGVHGGSWVSSSVFVVYGLAEGDGFLWKADLDTGIVRQYKIPGSFRKPGADEQTFFTGLRAAPGPED